MGHARGQEWKGFSVDVLHRDYYSLSVGKKLLILQILCDHALECADLRAEMDMREESEVGIDLDGAANNVSQNGMRMVHSRYCKTTSFLNREAAGAIAASYEMKPQTNSNCKANGSEGVQVVADAANLGGDGNGDECRLCGMDGTLLCCDGCPSAYHARCIGLVKMHIPEGSWYCPECTSDRIGPSITAGTSLVGAKMFGIDPYEQVYLGTCNYLLVYVFLYLHKSIFCFLIHILIVKCCELASFPLPSPFVLPEDVPFTSLPYLLTNFKVLLESVWFGLEICCLASYLPTFSICKYFPIIYLFY